MKKLGLAALTAVLLLAGCAPDRTLETLVPRDAFAVVLVDHPGAVLQALGPGAGDLPWKSLDGGKPWAGAVLPASPPGFFLALALADAPAAWPAVQAWAKERGGLEAVRIGSYAVMSSPGIPAPAVLDVDRRFDLERVRAGGDPVAVYLDIKNLMDGADFPEALRPAFALFPWAEKNLSGIRLGFGAKDGGLEVRAATDWKPGSAAAALVKSWAPPSDPASWTGLLPRGDGFGLSLSLPPQAFLSWVAALNDQDLSRRWAALAPLLGPRAVLSLGPRSDGTWAWGGSVETKDPQAVRQALRTLVASGALQKKFGDWALDADTPLIYQDKQSPDAAGGLRARVTLGSGTFFLGYGADRVSFAGKEGDLVSWSGDPGAPLRWTGAAPAGAAVLAAGSFDGLGAQGALRILGDGNAEFRVWVDAAGLKAWEERFPQVILSWLSGAGGVTRWEP